MAKTAVIISLIFWTIQMTVTAWVFMIAMGNAHIVWPMIPALGFWEAFSIAIPLSIFFWAATYQRESE